MVSVSCWCVVSDDGMLDDNGLNIRLKWRYLGWKSTAKYCMRIDPLLTAIQIRSVGQNPDKNKIKKT